MLPAWPWPRGLFIFAPLTLECKICLPFALLLSACINTNFPVLYILPDCAGLCELCGGSIGTSYRFMQASLISNSFIFDSYLVLQIFYYTNFDPIHFKSNNINF